MTSAFFPDSTVLVTHRRIQIKIFLVGEEYAFCVTNFQPSKQSRCALQSLLFGDLVDDLCRHTTKCSMTQILLRDTLDSSVTDVELGSNLTGA